MMKISLCSIFVRVENGEESLYLLIHRAQRRSDIVKAGGRPAASTRATSMLGWQTCLKGEKQMERKYEPVPGSGFHCWSLEKCEEEIFIVALGEIASLIPPGQKWQRTLEYHFFELGKGLADEALIEMNGARKHHGLEPISIRETAVGDYACSRDEAMKSQRRRQTREELREAGPEVRAELFAQAKAEEKRLPAPHYTYEDFKLRKLQQNTTLPLGEGDIAKLPSAWRAGGPPDVIPIGTRLPPVSNTDLRI